MLFFKKLIILSESFKTHFSTNFQVLKCDYKLLNKFLNEKVSKEVRKEGHSITIHTLVLTNSRDRTKG